MNSSFVTAEVGAEAYPNFTRANVCFWPACTRKPPFRLPPITLVRQHSVLDTHNPLRR